MALRFFHYFELEGLKHWLIQLQSAVQMPHRQIYRVYVSLGSKEDRFHAYGEQRVAVCALVDELELLDA